MSNQPVGGYKAHENHENDERVQNAANFAAAEIGKKSSKKLKLAKIQSADSQVVAGMNYKLLLDLEDQDEKKIESHHVTVYEPLGGQALQLSDHKPA